MTVNDNDYDNDNKNNNKYNPGIHSKIELAKSKPPLIEIKHWFTGKNQLSITWILSWNSAVPASSLYQKTFNMMYEETPDQGLTSGWSNSYANPGQPSSLSNAPHAFRFVPCFGGITGDYGALESVAHPGHYLRHYGYVIYLKRMTNRYAHLITLDK